MIILILTLSEAKLVKSLISTMMVLGHLPAHDKKNDGKNAIANDIVKKLVKCINDEVDSR